MDAGVAGLERALRQAIGEPRFDLWFNGKTKLSWQDDQLTIGVPNLMYQDYLQKMYAGVLQQTADSVRGERTGVRWVIDAELFQKARQQQAEPLPPSAGAVARQPTPVADTPASPSAAGAPSTQPHRRALVHAGAPREAPLAHGAQRPAAPPARTRRWRRLEEFVAGPCNQMAFAAANALLDVPGQDFNPLVLHGPVGTGKTHLLEGIYAGVRDRHPQLRVLFLSAEEFTNRFLASMHQGKLATFRRQFRECDVLLLDDLHFLAKKAATQEEFLHTFDALLAQGAQVVVTCDCHPRLADNLMNELTDRLGGGAVFSLLPPEEATRRKLIEIKSFAAGRTQLAPAVVNLLAEKLRGNVRELEGALSSLHHVSRVTGRAIDPHLAQEALADVLRHNVRLVQLDDVDKAVRETLVLSTGALQSKQRDWKISHPRMVAMYLARKHTGATYTEIGQRFGGRNHSTAVAGEKKVRAWLKEDGSIHLGQRQVKIRDIVERIEQALLR